MDAMIELGVLWISKKKDKNQRSAHILLGNKEMYFSWHVKIWELNSSKLYNFPPLFSSVPRIRLTTSGWVYYVYVKIRPCGIANWKEQPTGPRWEVPKWTYFPNPMSKIGPRHTNNHVLPAIGRFCGQLYSRTNRFAERSSWTIAYTQAMVIWVGVGGVLLGFLAWSVKTYKTTPLPDKICVGALL